MFVQLKVELLNAERPQEEKCQVIWYWIDNGVCLIQKTRVHECVYVWLQV